MYPPTPTVLVYFPPRVFCQIQMEQVPGICICLILFFARVSLFLIKTPIWFLWIFLYYVCFLYIIYLVFGITDVLNVFFLFFCVVLVGWLRLHPHKPHVAFATTQKKMDPFLSESTFLLFFVYVFAIISLYSSEYS